ncbi:TonB-dependent receptor [Flavobacterium ranwuense]|uniref:TonB-dependent receptor n=1 Tax=Flavobacterium ranwuense TaxID=2541725 RepID=A0ABY2DRL6_9FLAO|nr:TonB-dependent receptor [Flavobacterium ranwuense]TDE29411.1 TonB-dependent receptor [Flavobacterium ranwuense]
MKTKIIIFFLLLTTLMYSQSVTQTIRGFVIDRDSKLPIVNVEIILKNSEENNEIYTDSLGNFKLTKVPLGRMSIMVSANGYKSQTVSDLQVNSAKEIVLLIELDENPIKQLDEVKVQTRNTNRLNNKMTSVSARSFSPKEAARYAGSLGDPSRMARNFAGVSGANDQRNDIIIRGNSPLGLLWKLEGISIPNPNHFGGQGSTGGPISIINPQILSNSDFLTGAFPSEYGNATSGVFDLKMRKGNNEKHENTFTIGALGAELMTEGPISKKKKSSYMVSYRYSTLSTLTKLGIKFGFASIPTYQDLSFKINLVSKNVGEFSVFGIGGKSNTVFYDSKRDSTQFSPANKGENVHFGSKMGILGVSHNIFINKKSFLKTTLAITYEGNAQHRDSILADENIYRIGGFGYSNFKLILSTYLNKKINSKNTIQTGFSIEDINYSTTDSIYKQTNPLNNGFKYINKFDGSTSIIQSYIHWKYKVNNVLTLNSGVHCQYFNLNKQFVLEPRFGLIWNFNSNQSFSIAYGLHNQTQHFGFYYYQDPITKIESNRNLKFTQSNQVVVGYNNEISRSFRFKAEIYYQYLNHVPIETKSSSYSILNYAANTFLNSYKGYLVNNGVGRNYGLEFTLEKIFEKDYYILLTASLFDSKYKGSDNIWRNSAYNGKYVINALGGYEYKLKNNLTLLINGKVTIAGGLPYTPFDIESSVLNNEPRFKDNEAFTQHNKLYFKPDIRLGIRKSLKRKIAIEGSFDFQNIINRKNVYFQVFDKNTSSVNTVFQNGFFPTFQMRVEF